MPSMQSDVQYCLLQITNLIHNSFILQQYVCYTTILNMLRVARCSSSGGQVVSPTASGIVTLCKQPHSMQVESGLSGDTICPPEDEQRAARSMLRIVV